MGRKRGGSPRRGGCKQAKSNAETFLEYKTFVDANVVVLTMPPLVIYAYRQLLAAKDMAGYQASKDRATFQSTMLDTLATDDDELAKHIRIGTGLTHNSIIGACSAQRIAKGPMRKRCQKRPETKVVALSDDGKKVFTKAAPDRPPSASL